MVKNSYIGRLVILSIILVFTVQVYANVDTDSISTLVEASDLAIEQQEDINEQQLEAQEQHEQELEELENLMPLFNDSIASFTHLSTPLNSDSLAIDSIDSFSGERLRIFHPNPTRAVWMSALFPGLGQVYNRKYWKLPIIVGGAMGIAYALTWNTQMLTDYAQAYKDSMDNDPNTNSYMDFYAPNTDESSIDMEWLQSALKAKKDYYRGNRELSIICLVGLYMLCMIDAYVDASLSQFDISPDLSMNVYPAIFGNGGGDGIPSAGIQWSINF